jgi:cytoskeleton protein RodZ
MTAEDSTTRVVTTPEADLGPGERLREAREAAQLSVGEVASRLRLEPRVIERLESDDYDRLHGPTFVRGYLSGYARLLDLPDGPILEAYERHGFGPPALVSELGRKPEVHVSDFPVRMVTYVIAALLVVLVVLWWQSRQLDSVPTERAEIGTGPAADTGAPGEETTPSLPAQAAEPAARDGATAPLAAPQPPAAEPQTASGSDRDEAAMEAPQSVAGGQSESVAPTPAAASAPIDDGGETREPVSADAAVATEDAAPASDAGSQATRVVTETGAADPSEMQSTTVTTVAIAEQDFATAATAEDEVAEAAPAPRPAPLPGSDVLAIQLSRESWIEIYDRGGGRLYYSLAREGSEVVVQGAGPMRVLLGEVQGAQVAYNGEPYDLSRFEGRSVVRFTVGELSETPVPEAPAPAAEEPLTGEAQEPTAEANVGPVATADAPSNVSVPAPAATATPPAAAPAAPPASPAPASAGDPNAQRSRPDS